MGNCLKTQLKAVVSNDNLEILGCLTLVFKKMTNPTNEQGKLVMNPVVGETLDVTLYGDGDIKKGSVTGESQGKHITMVRNGPDYAVVANEDVQVVIDSKYDIDYMKITQASVINTKKMSYLTGLTKIDAYANCLLEGDTKYLKPLTGLTYFSLDGCSGIYGDIANLSPATTYLRLSGTNVTGDINSLNNFNSLATLRLNRTPISGNLNTFRCPTITYLDISNTDIRGDISAVGYCGNLSTLSAFYGMNNKITGSIEGLVSVLRESKTSGSIDVGNYGCASVTFDGNPLPNSLSSSTLSWTASTITFNGVTINA